MLQLIQEWGLRFERDKDVLPLFPKLYQDLVSKGVRFPPSDRISPVKQRPSRTETSPIKPYAQRQKDLIEQMKVVKGKINLANEYID